MHALRLVSEILFFFSQSLNISQNMVGIVIGDTYIHGRE